MQIGNPLNPPDFANVLAPTFLVGLGASFSASKPLASDAEPSSVFEDALVLRLSEPAPAVDTVAPPYDDTNELTLHVRPTEFSTASASADPHAAQEGREERFKSLTPESTQPVVSALGHATRAQLARGQTFEIVQLPTLETSTARHPIPTSDAVRPLAEPDVPVISVTVNENASTPIGRPKHYDTSELLERAESPARIGSERPMIQTPFVDLGVASTTARIVNNRPGSPMSGDNDAASLLKDRHASPAGIGQRMDVFTSAPTVVFAFVSADEPLAQAVPKQLSVAERFSTVDKATVENAALSIQHHQILTNAANQPISKTSVELTPTTDNGSASSAVDRPAADISSDLSAQPEAPVRIHAHRPPVQERPSNAEVVPTSNLHFPNPPVVSVSDGNAEAFPSVDPYVVPDGKRQPNARFSRKSIDPRASISAQTSLDQTAHTRARETAQSPTVITSVEQVTVADARNQIPTGEVVQPLPQPNNKLGFADGNASTHTANDLRKPGFTTDLVQRPDSNAASSTIATPVGEWSTITSSLNTASNLEAEPALNPPAPGVAPHLTQLAAIQDITSVEVAADGIQGEFTPRPIQVVAARAQVVPIRYETFAHQTDTASNHAGAATNRTDIGSVQTRLAANHAEIVSIHATGARHQADVVPDHVKALAHHTDVGTTQLESVVNRADLVPDQGLVTPSYGAAATDVVEDMGIVSTSPQFIRQLRESTADSPQAIEANRSESENQQISHEVAGSRPTAPTVSTLEGANRAPANNGLWASSESTRPLPQQLADHIISARQEVSTGSARIEVTLDPPELGRVFIEIADIEDRLSARLLVVESATLQSIKAELPKLLDSLAAAGVTIDEFQFGHFQDGHTSSSETANQERSNDLGALSSIPPAGTERSGLIPPARHLGVDIIA